MKSKKPPSMATVLSRTCPHCFTMVDPLRYGWHISKCASSEKQGNFTTPKKDEADNSQLVVVGCQEESGSLPAACTPSLAPDSQFIEQTHSEKNITELIEVSEPEILHLRSEKQALADRVKDLELKLEQLEEQVKAEKQGLANKIRDLQFNVKELECQLKCSKESEGKALRLVDLLRHGSGDGIKHSKEVAISGLLKNTPLELTTLCSAKQFMELSNDGIIPCVKEGKEVLDRANRPGQSKEQVEDTTLIEHAVNSKPSKLDQIVDLTCTGDFVSLDFFSCVDEVIEKYKLHPSTQNASQTQETHETTQHASNEHHGRDILAQIDNPETTEEHIVPMENSPDGSPSTTVPDEERHIAPTGGGDPNPNGYFKKTNDYGRPDLDSHEVASEMHWRALDEDKCIERQHVPCFEKSLANCAHSHSCSSSLEIGVHVAKAKAGPRRIVLSDSDSEGCNIQACEGGGHDDVCPSIHINYLNKRSSSLPCASTRVLDEQHDESDFSARDKHTEYDNSRVSQPSIKQLKEVQGIDDVEDAKHIGVRRSKRLRRLANLKSQKEEQGASSMKKIPCALVASSSSTETCPNLEATADTCKKSNKTTLDMRTTPASQRRLRRCVKVCSSTSAESSSQIEEFVESMSEGSSGSKGVEFVHGRSRRSLNVRKRLFAEVESKPAIGSKHSADSEDDDSEIDSDADSLKDFITDSEGREDSRSSSDGQSSSSTHSSKEVYCNPRFERDLKIRHYVWELEAEMLAAFAVNTELCLRAVCAINRRQTEDEQKEKISKYVNKRGFDKLHAKRGSRIADFLTDGDPSGPVKKSVKDLETFDAGGLELCKMLAALHSKQLFEIYKNAEDPHFPFA